MNKNIWGLKGTLFWGVVIGVLLAIGQIIPLYLYALSIEPSVSMNTLRRYLALMQSDAFLLSISAIGSTLLVVPLVLLIAKLKKGSQLHDYFPFRIVPLKEFAFWFSLAIGLIILENQILTLTDMPEIPDFMLNIKFPNQLSIWLLVIGVAFFAPFLEEIIFRGFLLKGLSNSFLGIHGAVIITALVWAVIHAQYSWEYWIIIFVIGLVFGYARVKTNSLLTPVVMHILFNLMATVELYNEKGIL